MEGFTLGLALVDAIPVLSFGISMVIIANRFDSPLFMIGAILAVLGGCCKVAWKLVLGIAKKDLRWLNKPFVPMMASGFLLLVVSVLMNIADLFLQYPVPASMPPCNIRQEPQGLHQS